MTIKTNTSDQLSFLKIEQEFLRFHESINIAPNVLRLSSELTTPALLIQSVDLPYSESGGPEGDTADLNLGSKKGTIKVEFETYRIPDRLQLRYESNTIFDSGFVGTQGVRAVEIPFEGDSEQLTSILTANLDSPGTRWFYTIDVENCPATTPLIIELAGGEFEDTDGDGDCEGSGTIFIGREDGITQMLRVEGATAEYDDKTLKVTGGTIYSAIGNVSEPLFRGDFEIAFSSGTTLSLTDDIGNLASDFKLAGLDVNFNKLSLNPNSIGLGSSFKLPDDVGGIEVNSLALGLDTITIDQSGVGMGVSGKLSIPNPPKFPFFGLFEVEASNLSLEYNATEEKLKMQGKLTLDSFVKDSVISKVTADLSGPNFVQIDDGKADIKGSLIVETDLKTNKGWGLSEIKLDIDTIAKDVGGSTKLTFPFKGRIPTADLGLGFKLPIPPLELNKVAVNVDSLNVPIPGYPLVFFQRFGGAVENFAPSDPDPIEFSGGIGATLGPQINVPIVGNVALVRLDIDGKISSEQLSATGKASILSDKIATSQGTHTLNWNKKFYENKGSFSVIDGLIQTQNSFKVDTGFNINMGGLASASVPNFIPVIGGKNIANGNFAFNYSNDGTLSNDFAAVWTTFKQTIFFIEIDVTLGFRGYFDGRFELLSSSLPPTNSFLVAQDTPWILLSADWTNPSNDVQVRIEKPDGTFVEEADFAANNIAIFNDLTDSDTRTVAIVGPTAGIWDIEIVDQSGLGDIQYSGIQASDVPEIELTSPSTNVSGGEVVITYEAFDSDSDAEIKLFYDTDDQDFDGILIADGLLEADGGDSFIWNTQGLPTGNYFVYGMIMDDNNIPVYDYAPGQIQISEEADLSVLQTSDVNTVSIGENLTYTVKVTNNGPSQSQGITLVETLAPEVSFVSATVTPSQQDNNVLTFNLGDLANGASTTIDITVTAPQTLGNITAEAFVSSNTFDSNINNNGDFITTIVEDAPILLPDLVLNRTDSNNSVALGDTYSYTLDIVNNGIGDATNVILTENLPSGVNLESVNTSSSGTPQLNFVDLIEFQLNAGEQVTIDLDADEVGSTLDSVLRLFDSAGNQIAVSDDNSAPGENSSLDSYIDFTASATDTYYAGVSGYSNLSYDPFIDGSGASSSSSGPYTININIGSEQPITQATLIEPNNIIPEAFASNLSSQNPGTFVGSGFIRTDDGGSIDVNNGVITANLGSIASGESASVEITVTPIISGDLVTTSNVVSNEIDENLTDNSLINTKNINDIAVEEADLELSKTVNNSNPNVGDTVIFSLTLTNNGPGVANRIEVTDLIPNGLSFVSASSNQGTYDANTGVWSVGNIRDGLSTPLTITTTVENEAPTANDDLATTDENVPVTIPVADLLANDQDPARVITNTAEVTSVDQSDPDSTPNNNNPSEDDQDFSTLNIDGDSFNVIDVNNPINGSVNLDNGNVVFTPNVGFSGEASFEYTISDDHGDLDVGLVTVDVQKSGTGPNQIMGTPGPDILNGTSEDDHITGFAGGDVLTGNGGDNQFIYNELSDGGDFITDFSQGDQIVMTDLLDSIGYTGTNPIVDGIVGVLELPGIGSAITINSAPFIIVQNVSSETLNNTANFVFA